MKTKIFFVLLFCITFLTYYNSLTNKYTAEDYYLIVDNDFIKNWNNVNVLFSKDNVIKPVPIRNGARPLTMFSLMLDYRIWGDNPFGYHLTNIVIHAVNVMLIFYLFCSLGLSPDYSMITSVLYSLHPIQGEVVNVPGFRGDLLAAMFFLLGLVFFIKGLSKKQYFQAIPVMLSYLCALLSKEVAIVFPVVLILYLLIFKSGRVWRKIMFCLPFLLIGALYMVFFWMERYSYEIFNVIFVNIIGDIKPYTSIVSYINTICITFFIYIKNLFLPLFLTSDYQINLSSFISVSSILGILFFSGLIYLFIVTKNKILKFSLSLFVLAYVPVSNILPLFNIVADRYMYIPMVGFSYVLFEGLYAFWRKFLSRFAGVIKIKNKPFIATSSLLCIIILGFLYGISFNRNFIFRDMFTLCKNTEKNFPENIRVLYNTAIVYSNRAEYVTSNEYFKKVLNRNRLYRTDLIWQMMGENYHLLGDTERAKEYYVRVLRLNPKKEAINNLAVLMKYEGNYKASRYLWEKILEVDPQDKKAKMGLESVALSGNE